VRYASMKTDFWTRDTCDWTADAKLLYLWTWTNDHAHGISGIFACGDRVICCETGLTMARMKRAREVIGRKVRWYPDGWLWVVGRANHACRNDKHIVSLENSLAEVPKSVCSDFWTVYKKVNMGEKRHLLYMKEDSYTLSVGNPVCPTNTNTKSKSKTNIKDSCTEQSNEIASAPPELLELELYRTDSKLLAKWPALSKAWNTSCPGVDIKTEVAKAHAWEVANPKRRKVDKARFLNSWLTRAQDSSVGKPNARKPGEYSPISHSLTCRICGRKNCGLTDGKCNTCYWGKDK